ncbi:DUF262 domain-containing protein [Kistimonas scapharcae]|uniref:DUF262 domain-containing protein n=2 Tax=Kistimonas scapharcae TaxID=1036133 RepID=A0ABP8V4D1_9GAMM
MIIAANHNKPGKESAFEILDGMQRLNAIISFIEGEFSVGSKYFDLESVAQTKAKLTANELKQKTPVLEVDKCSRILDYPVPFSVCDDNDPEKVDESFRRINTGGRTLSKQDVRQAGALGLIPDLIREAAVYIRKDSSHSNVLDLRNMKNISLSNRGLKYGVNLLDVFWARHGIITYENIRKSRDEELIAHLISYIADSKQSQTTSKYLDSIYDSESTEHKELYKAINKIGYESLYKQFCFVFDELEKTLNSNNAKFKNLIFNNRATKAPNVFQVIYIAFFKGLISNNLKIANYRNLCEALSNTYNNHLKTLDSESKWSSGDREILSDAVYGVIKKHFTTKSGSDRHLSSWVESLENILNESKTEQTCYDFKIGLHQISDGSGNFGVKTLSKIIKTLTAMLNSKSGDCYVIVGVADKAEDAISHNKHYDSEHIEYNNFCITGIDAEAIKYHGSIDKYEQKILQLIDQEPISESLKRRIKSNLVTFTYNGKEILLFKASRSDNPERYEGDIFVRNLSHIEKIERENEFPFYNQFMEESSLAQRM